MLKKILVITLSLVLAVSFAACNNEQTGSQSTPTAEPTATPNPIVYMTEDMIGTSSLTYKELIKEAKDLVANTIQKADDLTSGEGGIIVGKIFLLTDTAPADFNVLGYKYTDTNGASYIEGTYTEYDGTASKQTFKKVVLNYTFACATEAFAIDCMKRDVKALCTFAGVSEDTLALTDADYSAITSTAKTVAVNQNVTAIIDCSKTNDVLYYSIEITLI